MKLPNVFSSSKFTYAFSFIDNVEIDEIHSAVDLVSWAEDENFRLIDCEEQGSVLVTKADRKGRVFFAKQLNFPLEETTDFDELLNDFYTKKPLAFDERLLEQNETAVEKEEHFELLEEDEGYAPAPDLFEDEEIVPAEEEIPAPPVNQEFAQLQTMFFAQQKEIEALKTQLTEQKEAPEIVAPELPPEPTREEDSEAISQDSPDASLFEILTAPATTARLDISTATTVNEVLQMVKSEFETRLSAFVEQEKAKIDEEIKKLDKRALIAPEVTAYFEQEKLRTVQTAEQTLEQEKSSAITQEEQRHKQALVEINTVFDERRAIQLQEIHATYTKKIADKINEETAKQSEQLARILQGKTDELQLHQREINDGLKSNFAQVLESFNLSHNQVIQTVEKQKQSNGVIDFSSRRKQASA